MVYAVVFKPRPLKELKALTRDDCERIVDKIEGLRNNLAGDVKKLTNFMPEYRLRVGNYRDLFEVGGNEVVIYRVRHRKNVYQ